MSAVFPPSGDLAENAIKTRAGYVEYEAFNGANAGYFCSTCKALAHSYAIAPTDGYCTGLKVVVRTFGCCNNWVIAPPAQLRAANGVKLRVVR